MRRACSPTVVFGPVMPALQTSASTRWRRRATCERGSHCVLVGDVDALDVRTEFARRGFERLLVAVPEADPRARGREALRDGEADAGRAAGDDGVAPLRSSWFILPPLPALRRRGSTISPPPELV